MSNYKTGMIIKTKKPHPCGGDNWRILRVGADYKLECLTCGRIIMLSYEEFIKRIKKVVG